MKTVFKYPVLLQDKFSLILPIGFKFLQVALQGDRPFMWCEVDKDVMKGQADFQLFGTGQDIPDGALYLGTWHHGPIVMHLYRIS